MRTERKLDEILAVIGREHRATDAPESLERVLFSATVSRKRVLRQGRVRFAWALAAAIVLAAVVSGEVIWQRIESHQSQAQQALLVNARPVKPEPTPSSVQQPVRQKPASKSAPVRRAQKSHASPRDSSPKQPDWNSLDEFVPLPASEGLPAAAELSVVRMKLRGSDLQQYGLQAPADAAAQTLLAEFVVGEDGLPRAIRIVR
jgi:hypothetical protein